MGITPNRISEYKSKRREEGAAPATLNKELTVMSHSFNLAIKEWEWVKENPVNHVSREKVNNLIERWLTFEEEEKLLRASPTWLKEIIVFVLNTGLRRGEVLSLKWEQFDLSRKTLSIVEQKNRGKDTLPLNKGALKILRERAKVRSIKNSYVFFSSNGNRIDNANLRKFFLLAVDKAKIKKFRFHDLRHTWATRLVQAGVDINTVAKLGRWK